MLQAGNLHAADQLMACLIYQIAKSYSQLQEPELEKLYLATPLKKLLFPGGAKEEESSKAIYSTQLSELVTFNSKQAAPPSDAPAAARPKSGKKDKGKVVGCCICEPSARSGHTVFGCWL